MNEKQKMVKFKYQQMAFVLLICFCAYFYTFAANCQTKLKEQKGCDIYDNEWVTVVEIKSVFKYNDQLYSQAPDLARPLILRTWLSKNDVQYFS